jgi:hypothetical protein
MRVAAKTVRMLTDSSKNRPSCVKPDQKVKTRLAIIALHGPHASEHAWSVDYQHEYTLNIVPLFPNVRPCLLGCPSQHGNLIPANGPDAGPVPDMLPCSRRKASKCQRFIA